MVSRRLQRVAQRRLSVGCLWVRMLRWRLELPLLVRGNLLEGLHKLLTNGIGLRYLIF